MTRQFLTLRMQAVLFFFLVPLALSAAVFAAVAAWVLQSFSALETEQAGAAVRQALRAIEDEVRGLDTATADWGAWDDLAEFVQRGDKTFVQRNLPTETMHTLNLNVVFILNEKGETVYARFLNLEDDSNLTLPGTLNEIIAPGGLLTRHNNKFSVVSGPLLLGPGTCLLVSSRPILTTSRESPILGTLVMGRLLNQPLLGAMSEKLRMPLDVVYAGDPDLSDAERACIAVLKDRESVHIEPDGADQLEVCALLPDIEGGNSAALRAALPRNAHAEGLRLCLLFAGPFLLAFLLLLAATVLFLERRIFSRLGRLTRSVTRIAAAADTSERVPSGGLDEIAQLGTDFNQMMDNLDLARRRLMDDEARLKAILDTAAEGIITMDEAGAIVSFNRAAEGIFGRTADEVRAKNAASLLAPLEETSAEDQLARFLGLADNAELRGVELNGRRRDGGVFPMRLSVSRAVTQGGGSLLTMIARDITQEKRHLEMLEEAAAHDALTGLLNRAHFEENLQRAMYSAKRYGHSLSLVMCDVDYFKGVNDGHGHGAGDEVLRFFAKSVGEEIRVNDFAGRYGGDELCFALTHANAQQTGIVIDRIRQRLARHDFQGAEGEAFRVTASYGIAEWTASETTTEQFFAKADGALYQAKEHGRNRYWTA